MDDTNPDFIGSQINYDDGMMLDNNLLNSIFEIAITTSIDPDFLEDFRIEHIDQEFTDDSSATNIITQSTFEGTQEIYSRNGQNAEVLYPINQEENFINMENGSNVQDAEYCVSDFIQNGLMPESRVCDNNLSLQISHSEVKTASNDPGSATILSMNLNELKIDNEFDFNQIQDMHQGNEAISMNIKHQDYTNYEERKEIPLPNDERKGFLRNYHSEFEIHLGAEAETSSNFTLKYSHTSNGNRNCTIQNSFRITEREKNRNWFNHRSADISTNANKSYKSDLNDVFLSKKNEYSAESESIFPVPSNPTENSFSPTAIHSFNQHHEQNHREISFPGDAPSKELQQTCNLNKDTTNSFEQKRFKCEFCLKMFRLKSHLVQHKRIHTDVRPFSCSICSKAFTQNAHLKRHVRIHTGEKPFSCSICSKAFKNKDILNIHFRTHSKEKPYSCDNCDKAFSQKGNLKRHMLTHGNKTPI